ncbi:uncharacterized protein ACIBXB_013005 isoform 1-T3 [Morphnus guianensis]
MEHVNVQKTCTSAGEGETLSVSQTRLPGSQGTSCAVISVMVTRNALSVIQEEQQLTSNKEKENSSEIQWQLKLDKLEGKEHELSNQRRCRRPSTLAYGSPEE